MQNRLAINYATLLSDTYYISIVHYFMMSAYSFQIDTLD